MVKRPQAGKPTMPASTPITPVSAIPIDRLRLASAFHEWMSVLREEYEVALVATSGANAQRRHHAAVRLLYVPAAPDKVH
jgi:hypothetical protein